MIDRSAWSALALNCFAGIASASGGGAWIQHATPSPGLTSNTLVAVAGAARDDVWAVGNADDQTLAARWDGSAWTRFPTPSPGVAPGYSSLTGIAARAANDVIAVGSYAPDAAEPAQTLTLRFDGSTWSNVPSLSLPGGSMFHSATAVEGTGEVWAVGMRYNESGDGSTRPLSARWTGSAWQEFPVPIRSDATDSHNEFRGVAGQGNLVWAVGRVQRSALGPYSPLIQVWNGEFWRIDVDSTPDYGGGSLEAIAISSAYDRMVAVGRRVRSAADEPLIMMFSGSWRAVALDPLDGPGELNAVTVRNPFDMWASGFYTVDGERRPLLYHFDGDRWTRQPDPVTDGENETLQGMAAVPGPGGDIWAVGGYTAGDEPRTFALHRCSADLTEDGLVDFADYLEFLNLFDAQDHRADFTGDGFADFGDYLEFLNRYETGC